MSVKLLSGLSQGEELENFVDFSDTNSLKEGFGFLDKERPLSLL